MSTRRIVTANTRAGKSVFSSDADAPKVSKFEHIPGFEATLVWETSADVSVPAQIENDPTAHSKSWVPPLGGTNILIVNFPPDSVMSAPGFDPNAAGGEYMQKIPGLAECFEIDHPGMHTTDTVDYGVLLAGEIHLELDDGVIKKIQQHDIVIQQGTRHAWRNSSDKPATMLFVLVSANRSAS